MTIDDQRSGDRFIATMPIPGTFSVTPVSVINLSDQGACIEHAQPLRLAARGRLTFRFGDVASSAGALIVWSHLSKTPNESGKYLYHSGLRIEDNIEEFGAAVWQLIRQHVLLRDLDSLERKRKRLHERAVAQKTRPIVKVIARDEVPPDEVLLIQHARERLRLNPEESVKWYQRAKFAATEDIPTELTRYREDVLAVWEYLERSVPLAHIVKMFEKKG